MRKTFAIVLSALMLMTACCFALPASAAEGTAINTAEEFAAMEADGTYYLNADITISASYANPFTGTLDGNGKTVTVSAPMFAELNGTVKNLTINGNIVASENAGALACLSNAGCTVENVVNNANVTVMNNVAQSAAGGIIGRDNGKDGISYYTNVVNNGDVYIDIDFDGEAKPRAGGIGGIVVNAVFTRCINNGDITTTGANGCVGGIVGRMAGAKGANVGEAYYCETHGNVTATDHVNNTTENWAGGIFGYLGTGSNTAIYMIYGCLNTGDVYGPLRSAGIVAYVYGSGASQFVEVAFCVNTGNITYGMPLIDGEEYPKCYGSHFVAYTNSGYTTITYNISTGTVKPADFAVVTNTSFIGLSTADAAAYIIFDNYILEGGMDNFIYAFHCWEDDDFADHETNRSEIAYGTENGLWTIVSADDLASGKVAVALNEAADGYMDYYFYQTLGTDAIPTVQDTSKWVIDNGGVYVNGDKPVVEEPEVTTPVDTDPVDEPDVTTPVETDPIDEPDVTTPSEGDDDTTTPPPAQGDTTTPAPKDPESGCGSVVALSILACMIPAAVVICKKKRD